MSNNNQILNIYKSRKNLLEIVKSLGYDVEDYEVFNINEIDAMVSNEQLDMFIENPNEKRKIYIKYHLSSKQVRQGMLDDLIEELYNIENVLEKKDTLIIITEDEPNDSIVSKLKYIYDHDEIFVVIHNIHRLQFNILQHNLVPKCNILSEEDENNLMIELKIKTKKHKHEFPPSLPQHLSRGIRHEGRRRPRRTKRKTSSPHQTA